MVRWAESPFDGFGGQAPDRIVKGSLAPRRRREFPDGEFAELQTILPMGVDLDRHRSDMATLMAAAHVSVQSRRATIP